jgi:DNA-binding SARP family transcriptional activator/pimeloyl-ACP methyl ester carboxylesterase
MRISILGPLEVRSDAGEAMIPQGAKQRLLLAMLVLHARRVVSVDTLIELLWTGARTGGRPEDPVGALRTQVSRLRSLLSRAGASADAIGSEPWGYRLRLPEGTIDAEVLESALAQSRECPDPRRALETLDGALALWRGRPFEEFADLSVFLARSRSLLERLGTLQEQRIECLLALGRYPEAIVTAEALIREDPLRERPRSLLMEALYREGRSGDALAVFQAFRLHLSEELGLDPSPAIRELERAILTHSVPPVPDRSGGTRATQFGAPAGPWGDPPQQDIRFCVASDGVRLAFATVGRGPPLVKAANWLNHLEFDWESPVWRRLFRELSSERTLVRYDERASGLSDWDVPELSLETWVRDLASVVDACGLERFPLLGISQGCAVCIEYAARHPDRVTGLILHGGYAAGWRMDPDCPPAEMARREASIDIVRFGWGEDTHAYRQMFTQTFIPGGTPEEVSWFNELERRTVSPENAARFMEAFAQIDVRHRLEEVRAPTLVLHARGDQRIGFHRGRELAARIPGARFVPLESANHLVLEHEPAFADWMREAHRFLAEEVDFARS